MVKYCDNIMKGKTLRLINFLIDTSIYFTFLGTFIMFFRNVIAVENVKWISVLFYFLYYFLFEYFKGQTLGNILTKSKVIAISENKNYFFIQILIRTIVRFIPFDIFSYLFTYRGLHDWISQTSLVKV